MNLLRHIEELQLFNEDGGGILFPGRASKLHPDSSSLQIPEVQRGRQGVREDSVHRTVSRLHTDRGERLIPDDTDVSDKHAACPDPFLSAAASRNRGKSEHDDSAENDPKGNGPRRPPTLG